MRKILFDWWAGSSGSSGPTVQASNIIFSNITSTSFTASWTRGDGDFVLFALKAASTPDSPTNGVSYTANTAFGSGDEIGTDTFVMYIGTGTSVNITGLIAGTRYFGMAMEFFDSGKIYNTSSASNNPDAEFTYETEMQDILNEATVQGDDAGSEIFKLILNAYIKKRKTLNTWNDISLLYILISDGDSDFSKYNLKSPTAFKLVPGGTTPPTFLENQGYKFVNGYLDTTWDASNNGGSIFQQNDASIKISIFDNYAEASRDMGAATASNNNRVEVYSRDATNQNTAMINDNTGTNATVLGSEGEWHFHRTASNITEAWLNGVLLWTTSDTSVTRPNIDIYLGGRNANGVFSQPSTRMYGKLELAASHDGKELDLYNAWIAFLLFDYNTLHGL